MEQSQMRAVGLAGRVPEGRSRQKGCWEETSFDLSLSPYVHGLATVHFLNMRTLWFLLFSSSRRNLSRCRKNTMRAAMVAML